MIPGFNDPAIASMPTQGNLYFERDVAVPNPGENISGRATGGQDVDGQPPSLMFGEGTAYTGKGEPIVNVANSTSSTGHVREIFNFHGSPAPWVLIGILLVAGMLHLSAEGKLGVKGGL